VNCGAVALNTAINVPMFYLLRVEGLAAGHAVSYVLGATVLMRSLSRRIGGLEGRRLSSSAVRIAAAGLGMGIAVWLTSMATSRLVDTSELWGQAVAVALPVSVGVVSYVGLTLLAGVEELDFVRGVAGARLRGRRMPEGVASEHETLR
jgi:peptidoglycan biosynthesis protein MviN/MurJ (putative lipid II flippase)